MCMTSQYQYTKMHDTAIAFIKHHSMDDCSRTADEFYLSRAQNSASIREGETRMQIEKAQIGGTPFLGKKLILDKRISKVKIATEPILVDTEFDQGDGTIKKGKRLECVCKTQVEDPKEVKWQMNATTQNYLIDKYGSDTNKWVGLEIDIAIKQAGSAQPGIYPKDCSLEKVIS